MCDEFLLEHFFFLVASMCARGGWKGRWGLEGKHKGFLCCRLSPKAGHRGVLLAKWPSKGSLWH